MPFPAEKLARLPAWVNRVARDANGNWWGYSVEPLLADTHWYENEVGRYIARGTTPAKNNWRQSLQAVVKLRATAADK